MAAKTTTQSEQPVTDDPFWSEYSHLFTTNVPAYLTEQKIFGRFHISEEEYVTFPSEIVPISKKRGTRSYVMMHPFVVEPELTLTVGLYNKQKKYADKESPIGEVINTHCRGLRETQLGNAQAWYYPHDKTIVLWECFFDRNIRKHPLDTDTNIQELWRSFERWLIKKFPDAKMLATPFNDPIAHSIEEYQNLLTSLGYKSIAKAAFGKKI